MTLDEGLRERLRQIVGPVRFDVLEPHLQRDAVIIVHPLLELVEAAVAVAKDDTTQVSAWITSGQFRKPSPAERARWGEQMGREWTAVIVQPFVLIQDPQTDSDATSFS